MEPCLHLLICEAHEIILFWIKENKEKYHINDDEAARCRCIGQRDVELGFPLQSEAETFGLALGRSQIPQKSCMLTGFANTMASYWGKSGHVSSNTSHAGKPATAIAIEPVKTMRTRGQPDPDLTSESRERAS